jgi:hypothetical protein
MSEWRDFSRLPEAPQYWHGLRERIQREAQPLLVARRPRDRWWNAALASAALASAAAIVLLIRQPAHLPADPSFQASLAPRDPVAQELLDSPRPPDISGLLPVYVRPTP